MAFREWKKNKIWVWRAIDGVSRRALGWALGGRDDASCRPLIEKVDDGNCDFITDDWAGFHRMIQAERLFTGKDLTFPIEATNSDIRHQLARFHRRSKTTSRSENMVNLSLKLAHHFQNKHTVKANMDELISSLR
jgi:IS1 family transposase